MNIVVLCKTRNEEENIAQFCKSYAFADKILVADAESTDNTVAIARSFSNVVVRPYIDLIEFGGAYYSHHSRHLNFLFDWAEDYHPDWLISDDTDSFPTRALSKDARFNLEHAPYDWDAVFLRRYYVWYTDNFSWYFPQLDVGRSMWAWRPARCEIHCDENDPNSLIHPNFINYPAGMGEQWKWNDPYRLLHYWYRSEEHLARKTRDYSVRGVELAHPLQRCGELQKLPSWAFPV